MKQFFTLSALCFLLFLSCKKEQERQPNSYLERVKAGLKDSMVLLDYQELDFRRAIFSGVDSIQLYFLRVPFRGKAVENDFVIVETTRQGLIKRGKVIRLEGGVVEEGSGPSRKSAFQGNISIFSLNRRPILNSPIRNGYIESFHNRRAHRTAVHEPENILPEVIIVYTKPGDYTYSYSTWYMLNSFASAIDGNSGGYYGSSGGGNYGSDGYFGGGGGTGGSYGGGGNMIQVDVETQGELDPIDVEKFIKCFDGIPDAGSTCSIEIMTDIPIDSDPSKLLDYNSGSPGHVFINIRKSNSTQTVSQNIGFYPKSGWKTALTNAPIEGKFVDNSNHEFNASLKMNLSPENFRSTLMEVLYLARSIKYDIDEYNCTDFALDVFNKTRSYKLQIPLYQIPGGMTAAGTRTPQGLYNKLKQMKVSGDPEASNITIGVVKAWAGNSTGPCN
ncbi:MAG TPA: hypothetical protein VGN63_18975 [Flavisolibacter sp.]|jgi:hypothetical protein|nr:hypothetical protein [Flavisolibacter sp.]